MLKMAGRPIPLSQGTIELTDRVVYGGALVVHDDIEIEHVVCPAGDVLEDGSMPVRGTVC
jgi:hypothetical protein